MGGCNDTLKNKKEKGEGEREEEDRKGEIVGWTNFLLKNILVIFIKINSKLALILMVGTNFYFFKM